MSIVAVNVKRNRSGDITASRARTYTICYKVTTDNVLTGPHAVLNAPSLPALWATYSCFGDVDSTAHLIAKHAEEVDESGLQWEVTCQYASDQIEIKDDPTDQPVKYSLNWAQFERVVEKDNDGNPIVNTIGDIFTDPPYKQDDSRPILVAKRNLAAPLDTQTMADYKDAVNSDDFQGANPGEAKIKNITCGDLAVLNGVQYYPTTFEIEYNPDGWQPEILNRGHRARKSGFDPIVDLPSKDIRNLNEDGTLAGPSDDPYYIQFNTFKVRPFSVLNLT